MTTTQYVFLGLAAYALLFTATTGAYYTRAHEATALAEEAQATAEQANATTERANAQTEEALVLVERALAACRTPTFNPEELK
jgi:hypothetical protein